MPEGVESFVTLSMSPAKVLEAINQIGLTGDAKEQIDEIGRRSAPRVISTLIRISSRTSVQDIHLPLTDAIGRRYRGGIANAGRRRGLQPDGHAVVTQGCTPQTNLSVAELQDPVAFGKALDSIMLTVNKELEAGHGAGRGRREGE